MNSLDFIFLAILVVMLIRGILLGLTRQVASLVGILAGFIVAGHLHLQVLPLLKRHLPFIPYPEVFSYIALFVTTWLLVILVGFIVVRLSRAILVGWADRLLGGVLGLLKGTVAVIVTVAVLTMFLPAGSQILKGSLLSVHALRAGHYLVQLIPKDMRRRYQQKRDSLLRHPNRQQIPPVMETVKH